MDIISIYEAKLSFLFLGVQFLKLPTKDSGMSVVGTTQPNLGKVLHFKMVYPISSYVEVR